MDLASSNSSFSLSAKKHPPLLSTTKRMPQRGLGVAQLERLRLQEEHQLFLHHHQQQAHLHSFQLPPHLSPPPTTYTCTPTVNRTLCKCFPATHQPSQSPATFVSQCCAPSALPPPRVHLFLPIKASAHLPDSRIANLPCTQLESPHSLQDSVLPLDGLQVQISCLPKSQSLCESCEFSSRVATATETFGGQHTHGVSGAVSAEAISCSLELGLSTKAASEIPADKIVRKIASRDKTRHAPPLWGALPLLPHKAEVDFKGILPGRYASAGICSRDPLVPAGPLNHPSKAAPPQNISSRKRPAWLFTQEPTDLWRLMDLNECLSEERSAVIYVPGDPASLSLSSCTGITSANKDRPCDPTRSGEDTRSLLTLSTFNPEVNSMSENSSSKTCFSSIFDHTEIADNDLVSSTKDNNLQFGHYHCPSKTSLSDFLQLGPPTDHETCDRGISCINGSLSSQKGEEVSRKRHRPPAIHSSSYQSEASIRSRHDKHSRDNLQTANTTKEGVIDLELRLSSPQFIT